MNQIEKQSELVAYIEGLDPVREVNQSEDAANTLGNFNRLVSYASIAIIAILLIISIFLISNTISVGISVRKEEIGIMKYIGATDSFVRSPFVLEGIILGVIGAAIPLTALYFVYSNAVNYVLTKFNVLTGIVAFIPVEDIYRILIPILYPIRFGTGNRDRSCGKLFDHKKASESISTKEGAAGDPAAFLFQVFGIRYLVKEREIALWQIRSLRRGLWQARREWRWYARGFI